jgi:hypothetical protein
LSLITTYVDSSTRQLCIFNDVYFAVGSGTGGPFLIERRRPKNETGNLQPKTSDLYHTPRLNTKQRSQSLYNPPLSFERVLIKPDQSFSRFDPDEDSDGEDPFEAKTTHDEDGEDLRMRPCRSVSQLPISSPSSRRPPPSYSASVKLRYSVSRNQRFAGSLSNLGSVSETPATASAVSSGWPQTSSWTPVRQQPRQEQPALILSTPGGKTLNACETIREECGGFWGNGMTPTNPYIGHKTTKQQAWHSSRRHTLHSQPQPLSVQGIGYGFNRRSSVVSSTTSPSMTMAAASVEKNNSVLRRKLAYPPMVAGRLNSPHLDDSRSFVMGQRKYSSPAYVEAILHKSSPHSYQHAINLQVAI